MNLKQESVLFGLLSERSNILADLSEKSEKQNAIIAEQRDTINRLTKEIEKMREKNSAPKNEECCDQADNVPVEQSN